jgi:hypothetical protein
MLDKLTQLQELLSWYDQNFCLVPQDYYALQTLMCAVAFHVRDEEMKVSNA